MAVDVFVSDAGVQIDFRGMDRLLCFAREVQLPMTRITRAEVVPVKDLRADLGWRLGGGYWPGALATGWFAMRGVKGVRQLWCVYKDRDVLVIDTSLTKPCRIVLQHPDRHDLAWFIGERLAR